MEACQHITNSESAHLRPIFHTNIIMGLFERLDANLESFTELNSAFGMDQFAYKEHCKTTMALIKCQHNWLEWLDGGVDFVRVLSFDFRKAFDTVPHYFFLLQVVSSGMAARE